MDLTTAQLVQFGQIAQEQQIDLGKVIHEYYELRILYLISRNQLLSDILVFKGGTALRLLYGMQRYSDDLDFSLGKPASSEDFKAELIRLLQDDGFAITDEQTKYATTLVEVSYQKGKRQIKIEINSQVIPFGIDSRSIVSPVFDRPVTLRVFTLSCLLSGKISACLTRQKQVPRDIYDLYYLLQLTTYDEQYLEMMLGAKEPVEVYNELLAKLDSYSDQKIITDLNPLLPRDQREFMRTQLKSSLRELLQARIAVQKTRQK